MRSHNIAQQLHYSCADVGRGIFVKVSDFIIADKFNNIVTREWQRFNVKYIRLAQYEIEISKIGFQKMRSNEQNAKIQ